MKLTHDDVIQIAGKKLAGAFSSKPMGLLEFLRKGLNGRQAVQTKASLLAVKAGKVPSFEGTIADRFQELTGDRKKAVALSILCGRIPAFLGSGVGISGPTVDAESLDPVKRAAWQELRSVLAEFYGIEELRRIYPRSSDGVRVNMIEQTQDEIDDNAPVTRPVDSTDVSDSGGLE